MNGLNPLNNFPKWIIYVGITLMTIGIVGILYMIGHAVIHFIME